MVAGKSKMKKFIAIIAIIVGIMVLGSGVAPMFMGVILKAQVASSIGIIGGADGPTAIMLVGTIGVGNVIFESVIGVLLIVGGIWVLRKNKNSLIR